LFEAEDHKTLRSVILRHTATSAWIQHRCQLESNTGVCALPVEPLPTQDLNVCVISYSLF